MYLSTCGAICLVAGFAIIAGSKLYYRKKEKQKGFDKSSTKHVLCRALVKTIAIFLIAYAAVRPYMMANTNILQDMIVKAQEEASKEQTKKINDYVSKNKKEMEENAPIAGNPNGDVVIYEYFDYTCSACKMAEKFVEELIAKDKNVKVVLKNYPIRSYSFVAAQAAIAAKMQSNEKAAALHKKMINGNIIPANFSQNWDEKTQDKEFKRVVFNYAKEAGLDIDQLEKDMASETVMKELQQTRVSGNTFGLEGTPFFVIGKKFFPGALTIDELEKAVKQAR